MDRFDCYLRAPWWVRGCIDALLLMGALTLALRVVRHDWHAALRFAVPFGVVCSAVASWRDRSTQRSWLAAAEPIPSGSERVVLRAASRGPVPADPEVRQAACRLAAARLRETEEEQPLLLIILGTVGLILVLLYLNGAAPPGLPLVLAPPLVLGASVGTLLLAPRRLRRRVRLLSEHLDGAERL